MASTTTLVRFIAHIKSYLGVTHFWSERVQLMSASTSFCRPGTESPLTAVLDWYQQPLCNNSTTQTCKHTSMLQLQGGDSGHDGTQDSVPKAAKRQRLTKTVLQVSCTVNSFSIAHISEKRQNAVAA